MKIKSWGFFLFACFTVIYSFSFFQKYRYYILTLIKDRKKNPKHKAENSFITDRFHSRSSPRESNRQTTY